MLMILLYVSLLGTCCVLCWAGKREICVKFAFLATRLCALGVGGPRGAECGLAGGIHARTVWQWLVSRSLVSRALRAFAGAVRAPHHEHADLCRERLPGMHVQRLTRWKCGSAKLLHGGTASSISARQGAIAICDTSSGFALRTNRTHCIRVQAAMLN